MELGNRIKKFREKINLSQEELAEKVYTSRQTISNWENDKTYPDINSLKLLSNIFDVSLNNLIEGDIESMKKIVEENDIKGFKMLSWIFTIEMLIMTLSAYPLMKLTGIIGIAIWILFTIITIVTAFSLERIKKQYNIQTYKEIIAFYERKELSHDEKNIEFGKRPYQKILLAICSGIIALLVMLVMNFIFK